MRLSKSPLSTMFNTLSFVALGYAAGRLAIPMYQFVMGVHRCGDYHRVQKEGQICFFLFWYNAALLHDIEKEYPFDEGVTFILYMVIIASKLIFHSSGISSSDRLATKFFCMWILEKSFSTYSSIFLGVFFSANINVYYVMKNE